MWSRCVETVLVIDLQHPSTEYNMFVLIFLSASCYYLFITNWNYVALYMHSDPQGLSSPLHHILSTIVQWAVVADV